MPPTFIVFLVAMVYIGASAVSIVVFLPMLLFGTTKLVAKKVLATVLISFPCLLVIGLLYVIIFLIPALVFGWLANSGYLPQTPGIVLGIIGLLLFAGSVAISSLYLWYFTSKIIYQRLENKPIDDFLDNDRVFKFLRPYLIKFKLYSPTDSQGETKYYSR